GCRVPLPWTRELPARSWLPQPAGWGERSVEAQLEDEHSTLSLYRRAIELRPHGSFRWLEAPAGALAFERDGLTCIVNISADPIPIGDVVLASDDVAGELPRGTAAWIR
ncbi:MAG TPA: hypothetical protein VFI01_09660, partial [Gaiellaceae bacterium]|nr:hypothetical protein [Gaiellaceae bacterium]